MNAVSNQQALVLAEASLPTRGKSRPEPNGGRAVTVDGEARRRIAARIDRSDTVVLVRTDYFSRSDTKEKALLADASYSFDFKTARRHEESALRQFAARDGVTKPNAAALYARIQGSSTETMKGAYIDVFV